ncbi:hypothetical protein VTK73DRAFT_51 [Phialemonium thermophilum]|uniref:Selenoprotein O n=1 Tax=Phialemonium thermophilum TaxID=223376 RepID=A0ABR3Y7U4_9PEZI
MSSSSQSHDTKEAGSQAVLPTAQPSAGSDGVTLAELPKSWTFTASLPPDPLFPTPHASHRTPRDQIRPRQVRGALFSWVRPEHQENPELLAVSPAAMRDLGLRLSEASTELFRQTVAGNVLHGWDDQGITAAPESSETAAITPTATTEKKDINEKSDGTGGPYRYPWAQCYGGFQFGEWAGQLGDGRAISLFEATNPVTGKRYEVALKGAGLTPYSRFADGKAVLRSSIREFVVSEALAALGIPTTRALALTLLPDVRVRRETIEPGAIVVRFAETWLRLGTFDLLHARGDRALLRRLATYVAEDVFGGWDKLPSHLDMQDDNIGDATPIRGVAKDAVEGPEGAEENRFARLYREIVRRNAATVAHWQAYGFTNGVLNTDNTSVYGLSIDFGPFAFLDTFDPAYTPNHDDHFLRYSYRNQPSVIWWNLVRLGEALGELFGADADVDDPNFIENGVRSEEEAAPLVARAEKIIERAGEEYKAVFLSEYKRLFATRLGLRTQRPSDFETLFSDLLDTLEALELDFPLFFRRLSGLRVSDLATEKARREKASIFFYGDGVTGPGGEPEGRKRMGDWLARWRERVIEDWGEGEDLEEERIRAMKRVNPNFVPRGWILDEVIRRIEKDGEREVLNRIMHLALHPFEDSWAGRTFDGVVYQGDREEEIRWTGDVPRTKRALQCSCSS